MIAFECKDCGGVSYSSARLEDQLNPECPYCGSTNVVEAETSGQ